MRYRLISALTLGVLFGLIALSLNTQAQTEPPNEGNWVIDEKTTIQDKVIVLNGDLIVEAGGELNLYNVELKLNCKSEREYKIRVENNGEINIYNSEISSNTNYQYVLDVDTDGRLNIYNSTVVDYTTYDLFSVEEESLITALTLILIVLIIIIILIVIFYQYSSKKRKIMTTTIDSLVGKEGIVLKSVKPNTFSGQVKVQSEVWSASSKGKIMKGEKVKVVGTKGINIIVEKYK